MMLCSNRQIRQIRIPAAVIVVLYGIVAVPSVCIAARMPVRQGDAIWHVSTFRAGRSSAFLKQNGRPNLKVHRYDAGWKPSSTEALLAAINHPDAGDPRTLTCMYICAARVDTADVAQRGFRLYRAISRRMPADRPLRFVTWLWPTPKTKRPLEDFRIAVRRIDSHGYYLGWLLSEMDADVKLGMIGYSFGAPVVAGSVHFLAGGRLCGRKSSGESGPRDVRIALWSAAMHNYWLFPGRRYGKATSRLNGLLVLCNSSDPILKRYEIIFDCGRPAALGYTGLSRSRFPEETRSRIVQQNVSGAVGKTHNFDAHYNSPYVMRRTVSFLTRQP